MELTGWAEKADSRPLCRLLVSAADKGRRQFPQNLAPGENGSLQRGQRCSIVKGPERGAAGAKAVEVGSIGSSVGCCDSASRCETSISLMRCASIVAWRLASSIS